jgi:outer membrane protein assembly factor BamB
MKSFIKFVPPVSVFCLVLVATVSVQAQANWPRWRGAEENGHSYERNLPIEWNPDSVAWKTDLPGKGQSSPIIWGERIFLTSAIANGKERVVLAIDRNNGKRLWEKTVWTGNPEPAHKMNGWASASCVTDGERVYAFFGQGGGLFCLSVEGDLLWNKPLGEFVGPWGTAACPILVGNLVIQNCDADENSYLVAFDKKSGKQVWTTPRENARGWSTPILISEGGRRELVLNGNSGVTAYNPKTGKQLWFCHGFAGRGAPTVTWSHGLVLTVNGKRGDVYAIKPGGNGDVTQSHMAWHTPRKTGRDLPSPIVIGDNMLVMDMRGSRITNYDATTGKTLWVKRIGTTNSGQFTSTPVAWNGLAFFVAESGETFAIQPTQDDMKVVARNTVDASDEENFRASITPGEGQVFLRSDSNLYCIGKRQRVVTKK